MGPPDRERIKDECGDVLYYLARLADEFQVSLVDIVEHNISKLENRYE
jgi:NTP pyrophosphatase (non-canonical NTP hydrolase)